MKVGIILLIAAAAAYYLLSPSSSSSTSANASGSEQGRDQVTVSPSSPFRVASLLGTRYIFDSQENQVEYSKVGNFDDEYRVFGVTATKLESSPVNHIAAFMMAVPLADADRIIARDGCERAAANSAVMMPIILSCDDAASSIAEYASRGGRLRLTGSVMTVDKHLFKGENLPPQSSGSDITRIYLVETVSEASHSGPQQQNPHLPLAAEQHDFSSLVREDPESLLQQVSAPAGNRSWNFEQPASQRSVSHSNPPPRPKGKTVIIRRCGR